MNSQTSPKQSDTRVFTWIAFVLQMYSMWTHNVELNGVLKTCDELGVGFILWSPAESGFLTSKYDTMTKFDKETDISAGSPRVSKEF